MERRGRFAELTCSKLKDAEQWRPITLRLEPRQVGSCVLVRAQEPEARAQQRDELAERVFAFVAENGPVSQRAVEREIGGRATFVRDALRALETAGRIVKTAGGWEVRPESGGRTGTQPAGATPAGSASGGGKSP
jgi:hypothetical protein